MIYFLIGLLIGLVIAYGIHKSWKKDYDHIISILENIINL